jgi:hypothetical protein
VHPGYYKEYIEELVNPQLENWMNNIFLGSDNKTGLGNKYFDCKYEKKGNKYSGPCPVPYSLMRKDSWDDPEYGYKSWEIEYTLRDKVGYEKALGKDLGMQADWVRVLLYGLYVRHTLTSYINILDRLQGYRYLP